MQHNTQPKDIMKQINVYTAYGVHVLSYTDAKAGNVENRIATAMKAFADDGKIQLVSEADEYGRILFVYNSSITAVESVELLPMIDCEAAHHAYQDAKQRINSQRAVERNHGNQLNLAV